MSTAIPVDGRGRSGSGETRARPKATGLMTKKKALVPNLNEKKFKRERGCWSNNELLDCGFLPKVSC